MRVGIPIFLFVAACQQTPQTTAPQEPSRLEEDRRIRDLNHKVAKLQAKLQQGQVPTQAPRVSGALIDDPIGVGMPKLPVVKASNGPVQPSSGQGPAVQQYSPAQEPKLAGYDRDGNPIFYIGDAATEGEGKVLELSNWKSGAPKRRAKRDYRPLPVVTDRLPVTDNVPTIDVQLHRARKSGKNRHKIGAKKHYEKYLKALRAGNHSFAITGFRQFLRDFPGHDYSDNAQYWLAEAFYDRKEYKEALSEFKSVYEKYPDGNKAPAGMLKAGFCYLALQSPIDARAILSQLITVYPKSHAAKLARARLETIE